MKNKRSKHNYGVLVLSRQSICRLHVEWQTVEPPPPPMRLIPETDGAILVFAHRVTDTRDVA
jgi:hypothetical protein